MKKALLVLSVLGLAACSSGGGSGGNQNPMTAAQRQQSQAHVLRTNDPNTPRVSLDHVFAGRWSTNCQKSTIPNVPYQASITEFRANGGIYKSYGYFLDKACTVGSESGLITKVGTYELLDMADMQPTGDVHIKMNNQTGMREAMLHVIVGGTRAEVMQFTTTDVVLSNGVQNSANPQVQVAHRIQGT